MTAAPVGIKSENGKDRFYINSVAFVIPQAKANVIVSLLHKFMFVYNILQAFFIFVAYFLKNQNKFVAKKLFKQPL